MMLCVEYLFSRVGAGDFWASYNDGMVLEVIFITRVILPPSCPFPWRQDLGLNQQESKTVARPLEEGFACSVCH